MLLHRSMGALGVLSLASLATAQTTTLVSLSSSGVQGNSSSFAHAISADGRYVAFTSLASSLVANDTNNSMDVFVRDRVSGQTERVNVDSNGVQANGLTDNASISADGRFVAFYSEAANLVPNDTNGTGDVFVHDRATGQTTRVSVSSTGAQGDQQSFSPRLSADGRYVAFQSSASTLAPDANGVMDVFRHDRVSGQTILISVSTSGAQGNLASFSAFVSADGNSVGFGSQAGNLVSGDTNFADDVFVRDVGAGTTERVSLGPGAAQANAASAKGAMSYDGRFVAFESDASNLLAVGDTNGQSDVFVRDRDTNSTSRVSVATSSAQGSSASFDASLSADGRFVVFTSEASELVAGDQNGARDVFVRDRDSGQTVLASVPSAGGQGNSHSGSGFVSADGGAIVFQSSAANLVAVDSNGAQDVFARDVGAVAFDPFCFGDLVISSCPCANLGAPGHGCDNSHGTGGGLLAGSGSVTVASDSVVLSASGLPPFASCLFFEGTRVSNGGYGNTFGDGVRCVAAPIARLGLRASDASGAAGYGGPLGDVPVSVKGFVPAYGGPFHYQVWYRDAASFCNAATFNLTNALTIVWTP